jgi:hypothetical protein
MTDDIKISSKELEALNAEVESQKQSEKQKIEREVREKIAAEQRQKDLDEQNKKLLSDVETLKKSQEDREKLLREEFNKQIEELKNQRQSITTNDNPFNKPASSGFNLKDEKILDVIEENSRIEFLKRHRNVPEEFGKI